MSIPFIRGSSGYVVACFVGALTLGAGCGGATNTDLVATTSDAGSEAAAQGGGSSGGTSGGPGGSNGGINPPGAAPGGDATHLPCGTATCAVPADSCCVADLGNGNLAYSCIARGSACGGDAGKNATALGCSAAANCSAGSVCCVNDKNGQTSSSCQPACAKGEAQLCDLKATPSGCAPSVACSSQNISDWGLSVAYATCGGVGN